MTRLTTTILTVLALLTFGAATQAAHHEAGEGHTDKTEHADCNHAADEPCPHVDDGKQCPHHADKQCSHSTGEPCNHEGHEHGDG